MASAAEAGTALPVPDPSAVVEETIKDIEPTPKKKRFGWFKKAGKPTEESEKAKEEAAKEPQLPPVSVFQLYRYNTRFEICMNIVGMFLAICSGSAQPLMSLMFGNLTLAFVNFGRALQDAALNNNTSTAQAIADAANAFKRTAAHDATYLVYIGLGQFLTTWIFMAIWIRNSERAAKRIREQYLRAVLRQDIPFFDTVGAGEVATRIQNDTNIVQLGISEKVPMAASFISTFFTGYIIAFVRNWRLALTCLVILPFIIIAGGTMNFFMAKYKVAHLDCIAQAGTLAEEVISTIRTAQAFGTQAVLGKLYDKYAIKARELDGKMAVVQSVGLAVFFFAIYAVYSLAFTVGATLAIRGEGNVGVVINVLFAIMIGSFSLAILAPELAAIVSARGAAAKLFDTIDRVPPIDSASPDGLRPEPSEVQGRITFTDVRFNYPSRPDVPVLQGVDIDFPAGKTAALVGASGAGKSTIIAMVERFYDPLSGAVKLDGIDVKDLNVKWLRSQVGLVSQEPVLFSTSIRKNVEHGLIGTGKEHLSDEERLKIVREACIKANADGFVSALPDGYDTLVGERGFLLSGGQKQRIAIARAIVSDPKVLLLDEATSALDTQSEGVVQNALDKASKGRTTITIAHRLSTIKDADTIYVMGDGAVLEQGSHQDLLRAEGAYARLVRAQKLKGSEREGDEVAPSGTQTPLAPAEKMKSLTKENDMDIEKMVMDEKPLGRHETSRSLASEILRQNESMAQKEGEYGLWNVMGRMAKINRSSWRFYWLGFAAAIASGMVYPAFGIVLSYLIKDFQYSGHELRVQADRGALWLFLIAICATIAIGIQNASLLRAASDLSLHIRGRSFQSILRHDIEYFDQKEHSTGALTSGLSQNAEKISGLAGITLGSIAQSIVTVISGSIVGLIYGWKLALVGIVCIPCVISAGYVRMRVVTLKDKTNRLDHEESAQLACEAAGAIRTVASLTREDDCLRLYSESLEKPLRVANRSAFNSSFWYSISQSTIFWVMGLVFWYGSRLVASLEYSTTAFFVCLMAVTFGGAQAGNAFAFVPDVSQSNMAGNEVVKLLDYQPKIDSESKDGTAMKQVEGKVELRDVHFRYPTRPSVRVLREFNLVVEPGTHVALVGSSGCGKSTVIQLIERFYDPLYGAIMLDEGNIRELNVQEYRKNLALVSQEPTLYAGTVRFNVLLGATKPHEQVSQEEIEAACRDANILDFVQSLPNGFDTEVGGKGSQLSGGQKQRIAIARALIRNPSVLLLDEATSALDSNSEHVVQDALDRAAKGRTTISIAHRLSTIQKCDMIHFMSEGRIIESGTHDELLHLKGKYSEYVLLQDLSGQGAL